jgi:hypothetical protein
MKLLDVQKILESDNEDITVRDAPAPGQLGPYITTAQARNIIGVSMSRVRQFILEKRIKTYSPTPGRRDNMLKLSEVQAFAKKKREITGRPEGSDDKKEKE